MLPIRSTGSMARHRNSTSVVADWNQFWLARGLSSYARIRMKRSFSIASKCSTLHRKPEAVEQKAPKSRRVEALKIAVQNLKGPEKKQKRNESISSQSVKMFSVRADLEEKLKQKGVFTSLEPNNQRTQKQKLRPHNSQLETFDDFGHDLGDDSRDLSNGHATSLLNKVSQIVTPMRKQNKVSGDDDLPIRDDLGERRRKHELRVLSGAEVKPTDDSDAEDNLGASDGENEDDSEDELNNLQVEKLAAKDSKYLAPLAFSISYFANPV